MMTRRIATMFLAATFAAILVTSTAHASIIAGWDENSNANALAPSGFGFEPSDFPQAKEHGPAAASYDIANFDVAVDANGLYTLVQSFSGTTTNDLAGAGSGGSFSFVGDTNNGAQSVWTVPTTGYTDINVSWAQRGTPTGYDSRVFEYSTDGGSNWTDVGAYTGSAGALTSTWATVSLDLNAVTALNDDAGDVPHHVRWRIER